MINLSDALRSAPQLFVAGLPASEAVDHILTCFDEAVLFHTAVHMGSPRALEACNPIYREEFLTMCANPETLAAATESSRGRKQLAAAVTNPATPRTAKVEKLTRDLPLDLLLKYFTLQLLGDLSAHFAPETHEDLIARVAAHPEELTQNFRDSYAPEFMATTELPDLDALFSDYPDVAGRLKKCRETMRSCTVHETIHHFHGRNPAGLTAEEWAELHNRGLEDIDRSIREPEHVEIYGHTLTLSELVEHGLPADDLWIDAHVADYTPVWVQEWIDRGLTEVEGVVSAGYPVLAPLGRHLWEELDSSSPAMILAVDLIVNEWDGTLQELVETVKATTA